MITDRRKFITKWPLYRMSSLHFYRWNQFKVILLAVHSVQETSSNFLRRRTRVDGIRQITLTQAVTIDYWVTWHVRHDRRQRCWDTQIVKFKETSASSRIPYCGHSTQYSDLVSYLTTIASFGGAVLFFTGVCFFTIFCETGKLWTTEETIKFGKWSPEHILDTLSHSQTVQ